jgi:hypothetical protein
VTARTLATVTGLWLLASTGVLFLLPVAVVGRLFAVADRIAVDLCTAICDGIEVAA